MTSAPTTFAGYGPLALGGIRRLLTRLDRRPWSPTYGCFDREFWHYKTLIEFPRADFQAAMWGLALLYQWPNSENELAQQPAVLSWISACVDFWIRMQHGDGSVAEWYKNERSFCSTAYVATAAGETVKLLGQKLDPALRNRAVQALEKSAHWLGDHTDLTLGAGNQLVAALLASQLASQLTGKACCQDRFLRLKKSVLGIQHSEGWLSEHGGADLGYSLLSLDCLVRVWQTERDRAIEDVIDRLLGFVAPFVRAEGFFSGDLNHRATNHCFPYGIEALAQAGKPLAVEIAGRMRSAIAAERVPTPALADDTYAAYFYLNSYGLAATSGLPADRLPAMPETTKKDSHRFFSGAGLFVYNSSLGQIVINTRKGVWQASDSVGHWLGDAGYVIVEPGGRTLGSQPETNEATCNINEDGDSVHIRIKKQFSQLDTSLPLTQFCLSFKFATQWIFAVPWLARRLGTWIKESKIWKTRPEALVLERTWHLSPSRIHIQDRLTPARPLAVQDLYLAREGAGVHNPSSQLYTVKKAPPTDLSAATLVVSHLEFDQAWESEKIIEWTRMS